MRKELKQVIFAVFLLVFMLNVAPQNLLDVMGIQIDVYAKTITLSYDANGGNGAPDSESMTLNNNATSGVFLISSTVPTRTFFHFAGWSISSSDTSASYSAGSNIILSSDTTLYAVWIQDIYLETIAVSYDANGGIGAPPKTDVALGTNIYVSTTVPTRSGYTFEGWGKSRTATSASYAPGDYLGFGSVQFESFTLYAIWKKTITLTYNANGGSGAPASQSATIYNAETDYTFTISNSEPTRSGYIFLGWSASSSNNSVVYNAGSTYSSDKDITLYAVWKANPVTPSSTTPAKQQQVITASSMNVAYKSGPFYLGATTNGNGTLSYSSTNPGVASISSTGLVTVYQYGITQINIAASETANFTAASTAVTITVGPQAVKITKATSKKKKQLLLTWKKNKEATGYQMYISLSPNFDSYTFARACSKKYVKYTFTGLKSKKVYYVKSRSYKKIGGIYYFGPWSVVKTVKVK